jgi:lauroyl/myristoyl acyltransferase
MNEDDQLILRDVAASAELHLKALPYEALLHVSTLAVGNMLHQFTRSQLRNRTLVEVVGSLFDNRPRPEVIEIARQIAITELKNVLCLECTCWPAGLERVRDLVNCQNSERLLDLNRQRRPAILTFWHFGPRFAVGPALDRAGVAALLLAKIPPAIRVDETTKPNPEHRVEYLHLSDSPASGAVALKRAVERLQRGGLVVIAMDGLQGQKKIEVPFLNRRVSVGRGPAVLARLTGAPLIPVVCTWAPANWRIDFQTFDPLPLAPTATDAFDEVVMKTAVGWFDSYVRSNPGQLRLHRLHSLVTAPLLTANETG